MSPRFGPFVQDVLWLLLAAVAMIFSVLLSLLVPI